MEMNHYNLRSSKDRKTCLRRALQRTRILQNTINDTTINKLNEAISEVDNVTSETSVEEKVCNQQEVLMDSEMMTSSSKVLKTCTISLTKKMHEYDHVDFAKKLVKHLQSTEDMASQPNWSLLETQVTKLFKRTPNYSTLVGMLQPLEKKELVRKKAERRLSQAVTVTVPNKLASQTKTKEEDNVERTVRKIRKLIVSYCREMREPLDLFKLILHPDDFGRSIRNLLYVSFLIKDGVVKLYKDDDGKLVVQPCRKEENSQKEQQPGIRTGIQSVISLNMKQWTILKNAYKLRYPMIDFDEGN